MNPRKVYILSMFNTNATGNLYATGTMRFIPHWSGKGGYGRDDRTFNIFEVQMFDDKKHAKAVKEALGFRGKIEEFWLI